MATYQVWADIIKVADDKYFVTVSAVPKDERTQDRTGGVKTAEAKSLDEAQLIRDQLVRETGKKLRERGHVILDLIDDVQADKK